MIFFAQVRLGRLSNHTTIIDNGAPFGGAPFLFQLYDFAPRPNFLSERVRLDLDKEIAPDGTYLTYFPFGAMIERSRMTPYHKKFFTRMIFDFRGVDLFYRIKKISWAVPLVLSLVVSFAIFHISRLLTRNLVEYL